MFVCFLFLLIQGDLGGIEITETKDAKMYTMVYPKMIFYEIQGFKFFVLSPKRIEI